MLKQTKVIGYFAAFLIIINLFIPSTLVSQNSNYIGNEENIQTSDLSEKAKLADFNNGISAKIHEDAKNTYFAVNTSKINSKYLEIRILELCYGDKTIVSIGMDNTDQFYFFLVNNTLNKTPKEINDTFDDFLITAKTELTELNDEQLRLWLLQHNKSTKK